MNIESPVQYYWNSLTRFNEPVKVIGINDEMYAVEAKGHVYVVPKANISPSKKAPPVHVLPVTTAPRPDEVYWFTLTAKDLTYLLDSYNNSLLVRPGDEWHRAIAQLSGQAHTGEFDNEWFCLSHYVPTALLKRYSYDVYKYEKDISPYLPIGPYFSTVLRQLWEEQLRRDGIVPK